MVYLLFLHRLEDFNDAFLIIVNINTLKDFTVFSSPNFPNNFIVILLTDQRDMVLVRNPKFNGLGKYNCTIVREKDLKLSVTAWLSKGLRVITKWFKEENCRAKIELSLWGINAKALKNHVTKQNRLVSLGTGFIFRIWDLEDAEISENTRTWHLSVTFPCLFGIPPRIFYI